MKNSRQYASVDDMYTLTVSECRRYVEVEEWVYEDVEVEEWVYEDVEVEEWVYEDVEVEEWVYEDVGSISRECIWICGEYESAVDV